MKMDGKDKRALWFEEGCLKLIDQRKLPYSLEIFVAKNVEDVIFAINEMVVRGAPAIGAAAVYGMVLGSQDIMKTEKRLQQTRPTAFDLFYAISYMQNAVENGKSPLRAAEEYVEGIINRCKKIGEHGEKLITDNSKILTHCNAGALATVDYGTALAPLRIAHEKGKKIFVYADETRPRCQGLLTSWELKQEGIENSIIVDNASGYFMQKGEIDLVIVGADRIAKNGDFANKIGTYEKAIIAKENNIPFFVAAPETTFDKSIKNGSQIVIEERSKEELIYINDKRIMPEWVSVKNPAFDVTPKSYVTGYITEHGIIKK